MLTDGQRRHFAVLLSLLEETISEVEAALAGRSADGRLKRERGDVQPDAAARIRVALSGLRADVTALADRLDLGVRETSRIRRLQALVLSSVVRLEDSTSDKIAGYGVVDGSVARDVDPALRRMHGLLVQVADALVGRS